MPGQEATYLLRQLKVAEGISIQRDGVTIVTHKSVKTPREGRERRRKSPVEVHRRERRCLHADTAPCHSHCACRK